ncbi:MAG: nucleotidyltransferase domain-containing protein, partial [Candidatus Eremiobacteraeota bacterium]|nr:nucleotidyltransferase domain-containing protein [Candidatus Eremiobacteraeota bacterium]
RERLRRWGDSHRAVAVYLHGSVVRGKPRPDSDLDVAVLLEARGTWLAEDRLV